MTFTAAELEAAIEASEDVDGSWWEVEWLCKNGHSFLVNGEEVNVELFAYNEDVDGDYTENYKTNIELILKADGRLFRKTGYHQSFTGGEFDGPFEEVKPVEKVVTVYEGV